jgi:uncharacterized protein with FMN-binding domain
MKFLAKLFFTAIALLEFLNSSSFTYAVQFSKISLPPIHLNQVSDGIYQGQYLYQEHPVEVSVKVENHKIIDIAVTKNLKDNIYKIYTRSANFIIPRVLQSQSLSVPIDQDQTPLIRANEKAILLAAYNAISGSAYAIDDQLSKYKSLISTLLPLVLMISLMAGVYSLIAPLLGIMVYPLIDGKNLLSYMLRPHIFQLVLNAQKLDASGDVAMTILIGFAMLAIILFMILWF